jgi:hypothetical protein
MQETTYCSITSFANRSTCICASLLLLLLSCKIAHDLGSDKLARLLTFTLQRVGKVDEGKFCRGQWLIFKFRCED